VARCEPGLFHRRWVCATLRGSSLEWTARTEEVPLRELIAVPVDAGKSSAMVMACDFTGRVLMPALEFALTGEGVELMWPGCGGRCRRGRSWCGSGVETAGQLLSDPRPGAGGPRRGRGVPDLDPPS
jgi:hypothetical protein